MSAYLVSSDDYHKQRKRLNKRLNKLRHELNLITKDTKDYKNKEKTSAISAADYEKNDKYGLILLLTAERDNLYALEIKNVLEISNEKVASYKNLMISKIKRSLQSTQKLLSITATEKSDLKRIEIYIYAALVQGQLSIAKKQWALALNAFSIAKCALDFLYAQLEKKEKEGEGRTVGLSEEDNEEDEEAFNKILVNELLDTVVDPSLSLAVSQDDNVIGSTTDLKTISHKHCRDGKLPYLNGAIKIIEKIDPSFVSELFTSVELIRSVTWRDHEANLYNDEIAYRLMELTDDDKTNWRAFTDANQFDKLITGWTEVLEIHTSSSEKNQDDDDIEKVQDRAILLTYISYNLLFTRLKRDLLIVDQLSSTNDIENNRDIYRLFNGIISITQELKDLPGVYNDEDLFASLENLEKYFTAKKQIVLAESFSYNNKFGEALKIYSYIENEVLSVEDEFYKIQEFPYQVTNNEEFEDFKKELSKKLLQAHISAQFAYDSTSREKLYAIENINKYPLSELKDLVNLSKTPRIQPVLSKPVLFDVAFNYISYDLGRSSNTAGAANVASPSAVSPVTSSDQDDSSKKRGGFFGMFGRS
ncbi:signal recognition particle, subunit SRP68 [Scheffersomyces xylosifermentans]|uniref:signal recognition particle, subunit SRP68 n=1 Tax=Scheffersomyces xylosifermentans TaxID=1304137 RepID=UPI00315D2C7C